MSDRITTANLKAQLEHASKFTGLNLKWETWAPGDGITRYRLISAGSNMDAPVMHEYALGKREAFWALHAFLKGWEWSKGYHGIA